jgi:hypothetical protein
LSTGSGIALLALSTGGVLLLGLRGDQRIVPLAVTVDPPEILADGYETANVLVPSRSAPRVSLPDHPHHATVQDVARDGEHWTVRVRAGVLPGRVTLRVAAEGYAPAEVALALKPYVSDRAGDGIPDVLRLDDPHDRGAFRRWFTFLGEAQFFHDPANRPVEIDDCAALIRYAFREALRVHDGAWVASARLPLAPALPPVAKYQYPFTPLGAALFRIRPGPFRAADPTDGAFAQFADAKTLQRFNTHFVTRDVGRAAAGDLLFFRRESGTLPFHSMMYLGRSHFRDDGRRYLLYHTGPEGRDPGEIRRPSVEELLRHPDPQWRPASGNPAFLGVYQWNILR